MSQAILIIGVLFTLVLNLFTLAAMARLFTESRDKFDVFIGFAQVAIRSYADLQERVQNALDCLLHTDVQLETAESRINAARATLEESRSRVS